MTANAKIKMRPRNLAQAGTYLCCVGVLVGSAVFASASALKDFQASPLFNWVSAALEPTNPEPTRLSVAVANQREIKAALAKPIPRPEPLPPITAKLAYGHLRPGAPGAKAVAAQTMPNLPKAAMDAMAMDTTTQFRASSAVIPELHKVY